MDDEKTGRNPEWPDFIPPDFEESIPSAPKEPTGPATPPTVSGPVLPPSSYPHTAPPGPSRPNAGAGDRWFTGPAQPVARRQSSLLNAKAPTVVTNALIMICVLVWMLQNLSAAFNGAVLLIPSVAASEPWRFITSAFAHAPGSLTHIGFNMLTLWLLGRFLEPLLGHAKFLAVYLISALGGNAAFVLLSFPPGQGGSAAGLNWNAGLLGASGAIFGLFGAYLVIAWTLRQSLTSMWILLGMNALLPFLIPGIAWTAHLGGFLAGAAATGAIAAELKRRRARKWSVPWLGMGLVTVVIVASVVIKYAVTL